MRPPLLVALVLVLASCSAPQPAPVDPYPYTDILLTPGPLTTGIDPQVSVDGRADWRVAVAIRGLFCCFERDELPLWEGSLRFVRWPSQELVPGQWRYLGLDGGRYTFVFEPDAGTYEEGWFATQVDLAPFEERIGPYWSETIRRRLNLRMVDGWTTNIFRFGSQPLIEGTMYPYSGADDGGSLFMLRTSEPVLMSAERRLLEYLEVQFDGAPQRCNMDDRTFGDRFGPSAPGYGFGGADVRCPPVEPGTPVLVTLRDGFLDQAVTDYRGQMPPRWSFRAGENPDEGGPTDAVFSVMPGSGP